MDADAACLALKILVVILAALGTAEIARRLFDDDDDRSYPGS